MIDFKDKKDCCGCTACESICPHQAIIMKPDTFGFKYPEVDKSKCTDCGLCNKVCSFNENYDTSLNIAKPIAYAARHKDISEIMKSRSGAAFAVLSDFIIEHGGVVYGAGYKDHFVVTHKRAATKQERDEFRGSKYVQSDLTGVFRQVKDDLKAGLLVMFSGTPCQTSALNSFVGKVLRKKLYLVDIVCHGVPGPYLWRDYIEYRERKKGKNIIDVDFRDKKKYGWASHRESFLYDGDTSYTSYAYTFYQHTIFRESCYNCKFCNITRPSDITIADFWGWQKTDLEFNKDNKGVNLILINSEKGQDLLCLIKEKMNTIEAKLENCLQPNLQNPSWKSEKYYNFISDYQRNGFEYVLKKYGKESLFNRGVKFVIKAYGKVLRYIGVK